MVVVMILIEKLVKNVMKGLPVAKIIYVLFLMKYGDKN